MTTQALVASAIAVFGILVGAVVTLVVNYQNRQRARQNELFRKDPNVGIDPPPHPWIVFLRKNWWHFFYLAAIVFYFGRQMIQDAHHSYHAGVSAALYVFYLTMYIITLTLRSRGGLDQAVDWVTEDTNKAYKVLSGHNAMLVAIILDLGKQGLLSEETAEKIEAATREIRSAKD